MPASVSPRTTRQSDRRTRRRQAILETAARLFAREGYSQCEMERVAARVKVAKGTLYLYFPGKRELFFACVDWGLRQMQQAVRDAIDNVSDPFDRIAKGIRAYLAFFDRHPEYVELMIQERAIFRDRERSTYFEHRKVNLVYWRDLYRQLIDEHRLRSDLPIDRMVDTVGSLLYGSMFLNHMIGRTVPFDDRYEALLEIMLHGMVSNEERDRAPKGTARNGARRRSTRHNEN